MDRGASATKGRVEHCFIQLHTLSGEKFTKESVNKFLKSFWLARRSALQCDAGWETSSYQTILKHTRKCPKCEQDTVMRLNRLLTLKLSHSMNLAFKHIIFLPINISNMEQGVQLPSLFYSTNFCCIFAQFLTEDSHGREKELSVSVEICAVGLGMSYKGRLKCWISLLDSPTQ